MTTQTVKHGDAFEGLRSLSDNSAHAAVVDYPWKFNGDNGTGRFKSTNEGSEFEVYNTEDNERITEVFQELERVLVSGAWVFVFSDDDTLPAFREGVESSELTYRRTCVWDREKFGMGYYHRVQHYPIITATNGDTERYVQDRGTVFRAFKHDSSSPIDDSSYPTGKPVSLYREMLEPPVLVEGEKLLEPFCGFGPGASVAAERGLEYWGSDMNTEAVDHTRERFEQSRFSGQQTLPGQTET